ncbi:gfo/Idh/MocA family oxidoreductase [Pseudorhizobium halotolerans]|uniref:Gfo/Idh/MocA family oxidoreductase n=2 Tax=Pseudorhizobium halotolerans TaxID=1233081 RepID=A0ABN7K147_9HYPH|nr:gfo/Idh/MocA family oxidoreductase [Pseudorhizobium halotolerans]
MDNSRHNGMTASVAVVGCGHWGKNIVRNVAELGALAAVSDTNGILAEKFGAEYAVKALSWPEVLAEPSVKGVMLASPAHLHAAMALEALAAGKHVYVEKPLALNLSDAQAVIDAANNAGLVLMVGHLLQYHPAFQKVKAIVRGGEIGKLRYITSHRMSLGKLRTEEDVLWSFSPHDISMILALAGEMPDRVKGRGGAFLQPLWDFSDLYLSFPSGAIARATASWLHPFKEHKLVVVGETGMLVFDDTKDWEAKVTLYRHQARIEDGIPHVHKADAEPIELKEGEPLKEECRHFIDCIADGSRPLTDGREAIAVLEVLMRGSNNNE